MRGLFDAFLCGVAALKQTKKGQPIDWLFFFGWGRGPKFVVIAHFDKFPKDMPE